MYRGRSCKAQRTLMEYTVIQYQGCKIIVSATKVLDTSVICGVRWVHIPVLKILGVVLAHRSTSGDLHVVSSFPLYIYNVRTIRVSFSSVCIHSVNITKNQKW